MSPRPGGDVSNSSEFAVMGSGEFRTSPPGDTTARAVAIRFLREHTGQALLLIYLAVTIVSRLHDVWFYQRFRVNILNYGDPEDFFLSAMRNTFIWPYFLGALGVVLLFSWLAGARKTPQRFPSKWNTPRFRLIAGAVLVLLMAAIPTKVHADRRADDVRAGTGRHVSFTRNDGVSYDEQPLLLGSTGQFFFLYYPKRRVAEIVPVENTALMTVDLHPNKDPGTAIPTVGGNPPRLSP
jgi:hypothetical protein